MNRLEMNPDNEKYYSKEFMQGYKCGTKSQFDADAKVLEQIRAEIEAIDVTMGIKDYPFIPKAKVLEIIDKHIR